MVGSAAIAGDGAVRHARTVADEMTTPARTDRPRWRRWVTSAATPETLGLPDPTRWPTTLSACWMSVIGPPDGPRASPPSPPAWTLGRTANRHITPRDGPAARRATPPPPPRRRPRAPPRPRTPHAPRGPPAVLPSPICHCCLPCPRLRR